VAACVEARGSGWMALLHSRCNKSLGSAGHLCGTFTTDVRACTPTEWRDFLVPHAMPWPARAVRRCVALVATVLLLPGASGARKLPTVNYFMPTYDVSGGTWTGPSIQLPTLEVITSPAEHVPMTLQLPTVQLGHKGYSSTPLVFEPGSFTPASTQLRYRPGEITLPHHQPLNIRRCVEGLVPTGLLNLPND
jgi:hypothetical protein